MTLAYDILLSEEAEKDLFQAYGWYEKQRPNLGFEFEMCIEAELNRIARNAQVAQEKYRQIRVTISNDFLMVSITL